MKQLNNFLVKNLISFTFLHGNVFKKRLNGAIILKNINIEVIRIELLNIYFLNNADIPATSNNNAPKTPKKVDPSKTKIADIINKNPPTSLSLNT